MIRGTVAPTGFPASLCFRLGRPGWFRSVADSSAGACAPALAIRFRPRLAFDPRSGRCLRLRASIRRRFIRSRRCYPRLAVSLFPCYRPHTEALGSSAQIRSVSRWCWRYRVATKRASKAARITQMLRRIVRNLWRRGIGSCVSQFKRELAPWAGVPF